MMRPMLNIWVSIVLSLRCTLELPPFQGCSIAVGDQSEGGSEGSDLGSRLGWFH